MRTSQIPQQRSNHLRSSSEIFDDTRIRKKQSEKFYEQQVRKQFSEQFSQAVSEKMDSQDFESNQIAFGCILQKANETLHQFVYKMTNVKNDFQKMSTKFIKNGNSPERKLNRQISNKNMSWSSQKINDEEVQYIEKSSKFSFKPRKIQFVDKRGQSQDQELMVNEEESYSNQQPKNIFGNREGVVVSNFSSTITLREQASKSENKIQQQIGQSMQQSQLLQQEIKMHLNLEFCEKLPGQNKRGAESKRYHGYDEQFTERKRSNIVENQKNLPKSLNFIQPNTMKRQISIIDKLDINPQFAHSEKLNYAQTKIQSLFPQSQSIDLGRMSGDESKRLRSSEEKVQVLVCSIENQMIIGKLRRMNFYIHFSSIERLVAQNKRITIFVQPLGDILVRFSRKDLPNKFMKALGSYLLDGGN